MNVIEDLERKVQSLESQLADAKQSLYRARLDSFGLVPQKTIVICKGKEFLFQFAGYWPSKFEGERKPWITGCLRTKDGRWSLRQTALYGGWEIKPAPVATEASR